MAALVAGIVGVGGGAVVLADDVSSNLDVTIDAEAEVLALNAGGVQGTTTLSVTPRNGDGKNGCNLTGGTSLTVSVSSSDTSVATVAPSSVTFTACGDQKVITVTPVGAGSATVSLSELSNTTVGTFNLAPATFNVSVAATASNGAPDVEVTGVIAGASYDVGSVPVAGCAVNDAEDGASSFAASLSEITGPLSGLGLGSQEASCSYTDAGGLTANSSVSYLIVDTGQPLITLQSRTPANANGWNNTDVAVTWSCGDPISGVVAETVTAIVDTEGADQSTTGTCTDLAGNTTSATESGINIDTTAPSIVLDSRTPAANAAGWNNAPVTVTWTCSDELAGVESHSVSATVDNEGADQSVTGTCTDLAGNTTSATESGINIDTTAPGVEWNGGPANGSSFVFGSVAAAPTCTATDELSGVSGGCQVGGYRTTVGTHTLTADATDVAGNRTTRTRSYTVQPWTLRGFLQPVDMNGTWNTVKGGSTVPLKFEVFAATTELTDPTIASFTVAQVTCETAAVTDDIEMTVTGGTTLRYDSVAGQFIQNWQTPKKPGACYRVTMKTTDGSSISAHFKLK